MSTTLLELGKRIRQERQKRQLTLERLSQKTGLSKSFISQIERGNTQPSITSLKKIASHFGYSVVNLFPNSTNSEAKWDYHPRVPDDTVKYTTYISDVSVLRADKRKRLALPGSNVVYDLLTPDMNRQLEVMLMKVSEGENSGKEPMIDPLGEKMCFVMRGVLEVTVNREVFRLEEGDTIYYAANVPHSWKAIKGDPIEVIWILTPPSF